MALIQCPECQKPVSSQAPTCPNCGNPIAPAAAPTSIPKKKTGCATMGCSVLAVLFLIGFISSLMQTDSGKGTGSGSGGSSTPAPRTWSSSDDPKSLPATGPIRNLHELMQVTTVGKRHLIDRWKWEQGSAYVWLDSSVWNSLSSAQQRQLLDQIANSSLMDGLINMWLYVGASEIGRIKPRMSGGFEFVEANR